MKTVNLGIIGLGYIGQVHLRHCCKIPDAKVVAAADVSEKSLKRAKEVGVKKTFTSYSELLKDPEVEAVIIGLPTHLHLQCVREAAEANKTIFLEKPIARNVEEAKEILSVVQKNSVRLMMGYPMRFNEEFGKVKEKIADGSLGDIENAYATFISTGPFFHRAEGHSPVPVPDWWFNVDLTGGGVLVDMGSHMINLMRWYFGEITDIRSRLGHRFNMDFEDSAMCLVQFDSGTTALINVGWFSQAYTLRLDFFGSVNNMSVQHKPANPLITAAQMLTTGKSKFYQPHVEELKHFINCVSNDLPFSSSGLDGLKDMEAIELAYKNTLSLEQK